MKKSKRKWLLAAIMGMVLLLAGASPVSAELKTFLVRTNDGSYYEYNHVELNNSYLSEQITPGTASGKMYRHFSGLLSASGKVVGLGDNVKGYMDYPEVATAFLNAQLQGLPFDVNQYFADDSAKRMETVVEHLNWVDLDGKVRAATYAVSLGDIIREEGDVESSIKIESTPAESGAVVTLTVLPKTGMQLKADSLKAITSHGSVSLLTPQAGETATFTMPTDTVIVSAAFEAIPVAAYNVAGTFGPATGTATIDSDVVINVPGVVLQNLHITGNLTIGEGVGSGDVNLNNVTVDGDTFVRGGGKNSIHINGGSYNKITVEKTATGEVRIVATNAEGLEIVVSNDATGEDIILEGDFADVTVNAPDVVIKTQGDTTIEKMNVAEEATGCQVNLAEGTEVKSAVLDSGVDMKGKGKVDSAEINSDGVKFETAPVKQQVAETVTVPPVVTPVTPLPTPDPVYIPATNVTLTSADIYNEVKVGNTLQIKATVEPINASNKKINWLVQKDGDNPGKAEINAAGVLTATEAGWVIAIANNPASGIEQMIFIHILTADEWYIRQYRDSMAVYPAKDETGQKIVANFASLSNEGQAGLTGYQADMELMLNRQLEDGEELKVTVKGTDYTISKDTLAATAGSYSKTYPYGVKLSKFENFSFGYDPLSSDQYGSWEVYVADNNESLKTEIKLSSMMMVSKNAIDTDVVFMGGPVKIFTAAVTDYFNSVTISCKYDPKDLKIKVSYDGIEEASKAGLNGYYADAMIHLFRPLEDGEAVTLNAFGQDYTITNKEVPEQDILLSKLIGLESYTAANLAINQSNSFDISIKDDTLHSALDVSADAVLVNGEEVISKGDPYGFMVCTKGILAYTESVLVTVTENKPEVNLNYQGGLTDAQKAGLTGYYADVEIYLGRPLEADESFSIKSFNKTVTVTADDLPNQGQWLRLSKILETAPELATEHKGLYPILVTNNTLKTNLDIDFRPVLVNSNDNMIHLLNINSEKRAVLKIAAGENQKSPENLTAAAPTTVNGSDGKIIGVNDQMEYRDPSNGTWTKVATGITEITGLKSGNYSVRYPGRPGVNASEGTYVWVPQPASVPENLTYDQATDETLEVVMTLNENSLLDIYQGEQKLDCGNDYTVDYENGKVILSSAYLRSREVGKLDLRFVFLGMTDTCEIDVSNTSLSIMI